MGSRKIPLALPVQVTVATADLNVGSGNQLPDDLHRLEQLPSPITGNIEHAALDVLGVSRHQHRTNNVFNMDIVEEMVATGRQGERFPSMNRFKNIPENLRHFVFRAVNFCNP
ncbi:hypothetical protein D9M73_186630 [compost metagenome]